MARTSAVATKKASETGDGIVFSFTNGKVITVRLDEFNPETQRLAALHGLSQKIGDSYAGVKGNVTEAFENALEVYESLKAGNWRLVGDGAGPQIGMRVLAVQEWLRESKGKDRTTDQVRAWLNDVLNDEQRLALYKSADIVAILSRMASEKATKSADEILGDAPEI